LYNTEKGQKTGTGKQYWNVGDIQRILTNEKYCGDVIMQKTVVVRSMVTFNINLRFYSIISYRFVGKKIDNNCFLHYNITTETTDYASRKNINPLAGLVYCSCCGRKLDSITTHPGKPYNASFDST